MASFVLSFFPLDVLDEIWDLIESVSEGFFTYSFKHLRKLVLKKKNLNIFSMHFSGSNPEPPDVGPFWTLKPAFK